MHWHQLRLRSHSRVPQVFQVTSHIVGFCTVLHVVNVAVNIYSILTCTRIPCRVHTAKTGLLRCCLYTIFDINIPVWTLEHKMFATCNHRSELVPLSICEVSSKSWLAVFQGLFRSWLPFCDNLWCKNRVICSFEMMPTCNHVQK